MTKAPTPDDAKRAILDTVQALRSRGHADTTLSECLRSVADSVSPPVPPKRRGTNKASTRQYEQLVAEMWTEVRHGRVRPIQANIIAELSKRYIAKYGQRGYRSVHRTFLRRWPVYFKNSVPHLGFALAHRFLLQMGALPHPGDLNERQTEMVARLAEFLMTNSPSGNSDPKAE